MTDADPTVDPAALARLQRIGGVALLKRMVEMYLSLLPERVQELRAAAAAGDVARVERAAHGLKSSAGNVGAVELQRSAQLLESTAAAGAIDASLAARIESQSEQCAAALRRMLEELPS